MKIIIYVVFSIILILGSLAVFTVGIVYYESSYQKEASIIFASSRGDCRITNESYAIDHKYRLAGLREKGTSKGHVIALDDKDMVYDVSNQMLPNAKKIIGTIDLKKYIKDNRFEILYVLDANGHPEGNPIDKKELVYPVLYWYLYGFSVSK